MATMIMITGAQLTRQLGADVKADPQSQTAISRQMQPSSVQVRDCCKQTSKRVTAKSSLFVVELL